MAIPFLIGIDVTGTVDLSNLTIDGAQGADGQVLTSTGTGIGWENATGGTSETAERIEVTVKNISGGSLSKGTVVHASPSANPPNGNVIEVIAADYDDSTKMPAIGILNETIANEAEGSAVMMGAVSGIDTSSFSIGDELYVGNLGALQNSKPTTAGQLIQKIAVVIKSHASNGLIKIFGAGRSNDVPLPLYIDNTNQRVGISEPSPAEKLVVSEVRTGSTASDLYTTVIKSVQSSGATPNPGTGGLKVQYTSSSSNVHAFGLVAGSSSSDFLTTGPMHFYTNSDLDTVSATGFAMQLDTSQRLILGSMTASQKLNVSGNVTADRYYGNGSTVYYVDPNDGTQSANLASKIRVGTGSLNLSSNPNWGVASRNIFASTDTTSGGTVTLMNVSSSYAAGDGSGTLQFAIGAGNTSMTGGGYATAAITAISRYLPGSGTSGGGNLIFKTSGGYSAVSEKMRLTESGKLGIGIDPTEKLHVHEGFIKVQPPDISGTTPPSITISSLTNEYQSGMQSSGHLTMKSGSSSNFYWYKGSTSIMYYTDALYVNKLVDKDSTNYYLDPGNLTTSLKVAGNIEHSGLTMTSGTDVDQLKTVNMTFQLTADTWTDTGINYTDLSTGTYAVQVYVDDHNVNGNHYDEYYSGMMSWIGNSTTNSTIVDEIPLHRAGHSPNLGDIQLRTQRHSVSAGVHLMLQVKHSRTYTAALNNTDGRRMTFKFRRLI